MNSLPDTTATPTVSTILQQTAVIRQLSGIHQQLWLYNLILRTLLGKNFIAVVPELEAMLHHYQVQAISILLSTSLYANLP
jgi:hypothetical protein